MAPTSPTKTGEMREDKWWILKSEAKQVFDSPYEDRCKVHPVECVGVNFGMWENAPQLAKWMKKNKGGDRWLGRRINDEIELFDKGDEEELADLRESLVEKGFTVRSYVKPGETSKSLAHISYKAIMGGEKNTLMKKIMENTARYISQQEEKTGRTYEYGIIADFPEKVQRLVFARVDEEMFSHFNSQQAEKKIPETIMVRNDFTGQDQQCRVIGEVRDSEPEFYCDQKTTKAYFDSLGKCDTMLWMDFAEKKVLAEKAALKAEKKLAKKHRRQITQSTVTSPSENSFASLSTTSDEAAVKQRQREKQNAKRKAQRERRRAQAEEVVEKTTTVTIDVEDEVRTSKKEEVQTFKFLGEVGNTHILVEYKAGNKTIKHQNEVRGVRTSDKTTDKDQESDSDPERSSLGEESSSSESSDNGRPGKVVRVENMADFHREMAKGPRRVVVINEEDGTIPFGLKHLGRGL